MAELDRQVSQVRTEQFANRIVLGKDRPRKCSGRRCDRARTGSTVGIDDRAGEKRSENERLRYAVLNVQNARIGCLDIR